MASRCGSAGPLHPHIVFGFEKGNDWWPSSDQGQYPGADTAGDEYAMGFNAGITVETRDVVIALNDHEIKQSTAIYLE